MHRLMDPPLAPDPHARLADADAWTPVPLGPPPIPPPVTMDARRRASWCATLDVTVRTLAALRLPDPSATHARDTVREELEALRRWLERDPSAPATEGHGRE